MKTKATSVLGFACAILLLGTALAYSKERHAMPPNNPFLIQNGVYPSVHFDSAQTDTTTLPVWPGSSKVEPTQVRWLPGLTTIGTSHRPYPGGESAIFFSGGNHETAAGIGKHYQTEQLGRITGSLSSRLQSYRA